MKPIRPRVRNTPKTLSKPSVSREEVERKQDPVEVYCRIRPRINPYDSTYLSLQSASTLTLTPPELPKNRKIFQYSFNHIFTEHADQKELFEYVALPLLNGLIGGEYGLLFSYGVTGSGKTYTMVGESENPGIVPRCIFALFNTINKCQTQKFVVKSDKMNGFELQSDPEALIERIQEHKKRKPVRKYGEYGFNPVYINDGTKLKNLDNFMLYAVFISYVEIYNNNVYDLFDESDGTRTLQTKILREDSNRNIYVNGVVEIEVKSAQEALDLYIVGTNRKRVSQTLLNTESSRSHSIFTIRLVACPGESDTMRDRSTLIVSQLSLVDLAGSERCSRTQTTGARLKEAGKINNSLMALRTCLEILRENQKTGQQKIVPYRESRLTHFFKNYFEGEGKVKMIICVNPSMKEYDETVHVMKFAQMTKEIKILRPGIKISETELLFSHGKKDALKAAKMYDEIKAIRSAINHTHHPVPRVSAMTPDTNEIRTLISYLKRRRETITAPKAIRKLSDKFRMRLVTMQEERDNFEKQVKFLLPAERDKVKILKDKLVDTGVQLDKTAEKCAENEKIIEDLRIKINEKDFKLRQNLIEKQKSKRKLEQASEKMTQELDIRLRRQRDRLTAAMKKQSDKIELVKDILIDNVDSDKIDVACEAKENVPVIPKDTESIESAVTHTPRRETPVANVRYRRSRSAGDVWLEHRPANPVPLGTVLQPVLKCRKSVSKLTSMKDVVNSKRSKYILIDQHADSIGDLETKLYKGDIIPTCSGGAQVIFDDVEKLKQESPTHSQSEKKTVRRAYPSPDKQYSASTEVQSAKKSKQ